MQIIYAYMYMYIHMHIHSCFGLVSVTISSWGKDMSAYIVVAKEHKSYCQATIDIGDQRALARTDTGFL